MLAQEHAPELGETGGRIVERAEDLLERGVVEAAQLAGESRLCARDYLAHVSALKRDRVRNGCADLIGRCPRGLLGLKDDHRLPIASVVSPSPVAGDKPRCGRDAGHNLLIQHLPSAVSVVDRDIYHYGMHSAPPVERRVAGTLGHLLRGHKHAKTSERLHQPLAHPPLVLEEKDAAQLGKTSRQIVERPQDLLSLRTVNASTFVSRS